MSLIDTIKAAQEAVPSVNVEKEIENARQNVQGQPALVRLVCSNTIKPETHNFKREERQVTFTCRDNREKRGIEVEFSDRPPKAVLDYMKFAKFRWGGKRLGYWWRGAWGETAGDIRAEIDRAFHFATLSE